MTMPNLMSVGLAAGMICISLPAIAGEFDPGHEHPFGRPNPEADARIADFAFGIGKWTCRSQRPGQPETTLNWQFNYALNGRAIEDYFEDTWIRGMGMRMYNSAEERWHVGYHSMFPGFQNATWFGTRDGDSIVLERETTNPQGATIISRLSFLNIAADSFNWQGESVNGDTATTFWQLDCSRAD